MSTILVSFVVPVFNRLDLTRAFVADLRATVAGDHWEALFVDDGSTDGTREFLATLSPPFRSVVLPENGGYARAVNRGVAEARGAILGLVNNDLVLRPHWFGPMLRLLAAAPKAGVIGNVQMNPATGLVDHAGVFFDLNGMPAHAHKHRKRAPRGHWRERNAVTGACMVMRRQLFEEVGGFFEGYRNGMEDIDLCVRVRRAGHRIFVTHESVIGHLLSSSPGRNDANAANTDLFRQRCAAITAAWGREEWAAEYFRRYARRWWRIDPARAWLALRLLIGLGGAAKNPVA